MVWKSMAEKFESTSRSLKERTLPLPAYIWESLLIVLRVAIEAVEAEVVMRGAVVVVVGMEGTVTTGLPLLTIPVTKEEAVIRDPDLILPVSIPTIIEGFIDYTIGVMFCVIFNTSITYVSIEHKL